LQERLGRDYADAKAIHARLISNSPTYKRLTEQGSLTVADFRRGLRQDEALVHLVYYDIGEMIALVIKKDDVGIFELKLNLHDDEQPGKTTHHSIAQKVLLSLRSGGAYDIKDAKRLYDTLFTPLKGTLQGITHIVIVPDRQFVTLPFAALVKNDAASVREAQWLAYEYSFTLVPSLRGFVALRSQRDAGGAQGSFVGFANPNIAVPRDECAPLSAWGPKQVRARILCPVPETIDHVTALARGWPSGAGKEVFEKERFAIPTLTRALDKPISLLAFATHGLLSGETMKQVGIAQPALLLSPAPGVPGSEWLTADKIEALTMDVRLVVLSACNSSAPQDENGEALSGLARAFFEAGARGVLVSNWYIDVAKTRALLEDLSSAFTRTKLDDMSIPLREAMLERLKQDPDPRNWAMFAYIGQ
jgi:CHAT domain-containing protein